MTIRDALTEATRELRDIPQASKEAATLLAFVIGKDEAWLIAHGDEALSKSDERRVLTFAQRRGRHEPMAYLLGYQPFYGHNFVVNEHVLIPRPDSELIIDTLKQDLAGVSDPVIVDVGTGSGALAISAALAFPKAEVYGLDVSDAALQVAQTNRKNLNASVQLHSSDLLTYCLEHKLKADAILANLPYLPAEEISASPTKEELSYEPQLALVADDQGLSLIKRCIEQAITVLKPGGTLYLEMLPGQIPLVAFWVVMRGFPFTSRQMTDLSGQNRVLALSLVG